MIERVAKDIDPDYDYAKDNYFMYIPEITERVYTSKEINSEIL